MEQNFGIVGYGIVGNATHLSLFPNENPKIHDIKFNTTLEILQGCGVVFFCTPTDTKDDIFKLVLSIKELKKINRNVLIVVRSTVPIGTCNSIQEEISNNILYLPEFLRDRMWQKDCLKRPLIVGTDQSEVPAFLKDEKLKICTLKEAETLKMFSNTLATAKITFANHFFELCKKNGSDYQCVLDLYNMTSHDQSYLEVNNNLRGFGGKCLTKDLDFLINTFKENRLDETLFTSIQRDNTLWPTTIRKS